MCRLLAVVSGQPRVLTELLDKELAAFVELSSIHADGWGVAAWDEDESLVTHKQPGAAYLEPRMTAFTDTLVTDAALLHLRKASAGMAVNPRNTHPFVSGRLAFAHNGFFAPASLVDETLAQLGGPEVAGDTDSERYFALVRAFLPEKGPAGALLAAAELITSRAEELVSLNAMMLTEDALYAYSQYAPDAASATLESGGSSYDLRWRRKEDEVMVASTGWDATDATWETLPQGTVLEVRRHDLSVTVGAHASAAKVQAMERR
jgi:predicted glutamine amidotransferase